MPPNRFPLLPALLLLILSPLSLPAAASPSPEIRIGSKQFTESVILAEIITGVVSHAGAAAQHRQELGGTRVLWDALAKGEIDMYPEYTGTLRQEIFAGQAIGSDDDLRQALATRGIGMTASLGFSDNYAIGMKEELCDRLRIRSISDLRRHPELRFGFSNEFMERGDGWPGLRSKYQLPQRNVFGLQHDLAYRGLASGAIAATDLYSTDAEISYYRLRTLTDDLHYFPVYTAVVLYRKGLEKREPQVVAALSRLAGSIDEQGMIAMNRRAKIGKVPEKKVAADFLAKGLLPGKAARLESRAERIWRRTLEHLVLVSLSLCAAIVCGIPTGVAAAKFPSLGQLLLGCVGVLQTIPSLALLVFLIPLLGIGVAPTIVALFLYSLLPIVRNTHAGFREIAQQSRESAEALGLPAAARLKLVELPLASREILAGIKTSAVINVGTATLGALIGAGGYGQPILTGIRLDDIGLILEGAVPAALLALLVQGAFELAELVVVPKGLRLKQAK
jgi:osmoprotectant transport system permease protein